MAHFRISAEQPDVHTSFSVDEQLYTGGAVAASAFCRVAWLLRRHASFTFCAAAGCTGDWPLFLLHTAAVDFLRTAVEKGTAAFSKPNSATGSFFGRYLSVSGQKNAHRLDCHGAVLCMWLRGGNVSWSLECENFSEDPDVNVNRQLYLVSYDRNRTKSCKRLKMLCFSAILRHFYR